MSVRSRRLFPTGKAWQAAEKHFDLSRNIHYVLAEKIKVVAVVNACKNGDDDDKERTTLLIIKMRKKNLLVIRMEVRERHTDKRKPNDSAVEKAHVQKEKWNTEAKQLL